MDDGQENERDDTDGLHPIDRIAFRFEQLVEELRTAQERDDRSGLGRHYAIVVTEVEKARAHFDYYVARADPEDYNTLLNGVLYHWDVVDVDHVRLTRVMNAD